MGKFLDAVDDLKPLAESRGFKVGPQSINGEITVLLTRTLARTEQTYICFPSVFDTKDFLERQPEIPKHKVLVTYGDGSGHVLDIRAWRTHEAMSLAADAAAHRRPASKLKLLAIV